ncbi:CPBP family intramembrane glutamic endopeptidase [Diaminobutyricibacter sp. McL0618]|uniref:CPBP family intramembrane glutamic endopeptidase n=1 Tax=Leifsonia sp. McL0618 TaxID=3415677 RepID=UPI003CEBBBDE
MRADSMRLRRPDDTTRVSGRSVLAVLGLWVGSAVVLATAGWFLTSAMTGVDSETPTLVAVFLVYLLLPVSALIVYRWQGVRDRLAVRPAAGRWFRTAILVWLVILAACGIVYFALGFASGSAIGAWLDVIRDATDMSRFATATPLDWALIVIRALILAGVAEELLFRGILYGWLRGYLPAWAVILITSVAFALEHGFYPILLPLGLFFGLGLGWLRERSGSILPGLVVHVLTDALFFIIALAAAAGMGT